MDINESFAKAEQILVPWTGVVLHPAPDRMDVVIPARSLVEAVTALVEANWGYLSAITGLDHPGSSEPTSEELRWQRLSEEVESPSEDESREGTLEALYHFCEGAALLTLRVTVRYTSSVLPSICKIQPAATLYEREIMELSGIKVAGTPNSDRLLLSDDWPEGVYPMRKSFTSLKDLAAVKGKETK
jgi:NADH:ubiquinone oxidoreductase subunit C